MLLHKTAWLTLGFFLLTFIATGGIAEAQAPLKDPKPRENSKKKWKVIDGFRSAKFGMDEKQVLRAIAKDFKISKSKVQRKIHPKAKTTILILHHPKLMEIGGPADIAYILGYRSNKLTQINIVWGGGAEKNVAPKTVVDAANFLRIHLIKKQYKKEGFVTNGRMDDVTTLVFRGKDKKNRMALLILTTPKINKDEITKKAAQKYTLKLSYILKPDAPDIFQNKTK
jgi:hypothetical protein